MTRQAGATLLQKHNLVDMAIDFMLDNNEFHQAFELAEHTAPHKLPEVHLKKALALEDDERCAAVQEPRAEGWRALPRGSRRELNEASPPRCTNTTLRAQPKAATAALRVFSLCSSFAKCLRGRPPPF